MELLVVISIVSVFSAVILTATSQAKLKAQNSKVNQTARQYILAIKMYEVTKGTYPIIADMNWHCLGTGYPGSICGYIDTSPTTENPVLNNGLLPYLPNQQAVSTKPIQLGGGGCTPEEILDFTCVPGPSDKYVGMSYVCSEASAGICTKAAIVWVLEGQDNCSIGGAVSIFNNPNTFCLFNLTDNY